MVEQGNHCISGYRQLQRLRTALAIARASAILGALQREAESTVSHDQAKRVTYLTELFLRIHRELFHDWKEQATVSHRPGNMPESSKRKRFREVIESLVLDGDENKITAIFDHNGFVMRTSNIAERLSLCYQRMRAVRPFGYGNQITLDFFMTALGDLPAFKAVYPLGIDFRRLEPGDPAVLHDLNSSHDQVTRAFQHAIDPARTKYLHNQANAYGRWPENKKFLLGIPFLSHRTADGIDCLVTVNGGLVPLSQIDTGLFTPGAHFADYSLDIVRHAIGYLPGTESLRAVAGQEIDGITTVDGLAPLFCLDVNILTGLRMPSHTELVELLKQCEGESATVFSLAGNEQVKNRLLNASEGDSRLQRGVAIAYQRLGRLVQKLEAALRAIFLGKLPVDRPKLFMAMGGAGSGKTAVEELAAAQCGDNFVIASLDQFRMLSDLYGVLTAASHHSDDYVFVEPFANRLRGLVASQARKWHINILYDGTGIPYKPRYSDLIDQFHQAGFQTQIAAVDAFIVKPEGREDELPRSAVISGVKRRFEKTGRALPWVVTVDKHIRAPASFLAALQHKSLDKLSLFANDAERGKQYLVAESVVCSDDEVRALQRHQIAGSLLEHLRNLIETSEGSALRRLAGNDAGRLAELMDRNPAFTEGNAAYLVYRSHATNRVLLVYNVRRLVDFIEKRQLNPNASGEEGLLHKPDNLAFHVDPSGKQPWITRLQDSPLEQREHSWL